MRLLPLTCAGFAILLSSCSADPFGPPPPGGVAVYAHLPPQQAMIDRLGMHMTITMVEVRMGEPCLRYTAACTVAVDVHQGWQTLFPGHHVRWGYWHRVDEAAPTLRGSWTPGGPAEGRPLGASLVIGGVYNPAISELLPGEGRFALMVPLDESFELSLAGWPDLQARGARFRLVIDPKLWFFSESEQRLLRIEGLTGRLVDDSTAEGRLLRERIRASLRVEPF
jgi:hypothetical protein